MTQIKLRRDTSANFTSKNPVLGLGEPAYETDTKKLKIGDGTTAYTQLEYFSAGGGGSADIGAALPLKIVNGVISLEVDGQTIQVVDGKLAASANMVTTDTAQNISGQKEFDKTILFLGNNDLLRAQQSTSYRNGAGLSMGANSTSTDGGVFAPQWKIYNTTGNVDRTETIITTYNQSKLNSSNFNTANKLVRLDSNGKLPAVDGSNLTNLLGGLELCDIGMALYVDETKGLRRYLNGQIVDINTNTQAFLNRLKEITTLHPSLLCTEEEWQTAKTMSVFGQVGKFVFNYSGDAIVSVRLPRVVNVQGLFDLQNLGMTVEAGLPNITGNFGGLETQTNGAFRFNSVTFKRAGGEVKTGGAVSFDASRSSSIYKDGATVQQEAIQYPYFIQIATGQETEANIVNTLENVNGFTLLESKYSDKPLYNESWLLSNGQYNPKATYPTAYEGLQVEYNAEIEAGTTVTLPSGISYTKRGLSVKLLTEEYTDYDFVLNTADETFRLPLLDGSEDLPSDRHDSLTLLASGSTYTAPANGWMYLLANTGTDIQMYSLSGLGLSSVIHSNNISLATYLPCKKGDIVQIVYTISNLNRFEFVYAQGNGSLYFYVGETVQNANLIDAGRIGEQLANKVDTSNTQWATNACMPDYSAGVSMTSPWTAPFDAECHISTTQANGTIGTVYVNNYFISRADSERNQRTIGTFSITVKKGDVVTGDGWITSYSNAFPIIGGNK